MKVIYLDVYFAINFLMDFLILLILRCILKKKTVFRLVMSALIGAVYACIILVTNADGIIWMLCTYVVISTIMIIVAFGIADIRKMIKRSALLYLITFTANGIINVLYTKISFFPIMIIMAFGIISILLRCLVEHMSISRSLCNVKLENAGKSTMATAIIDTGNCLLEPISGKPVSIIERDTYQKLGLGDYTKELVRVIPFNSLGKEKGILLGVQIDYMEITKEGAKIKVTGPMLGIYEKRLSSKGEYDMLLHPQVAKF
ncbi:MAG: sigma-E processing peptidase SpoIIGA [Eubacterium sp.]